MSDAPAPALELRTARLLLRRWREADRAPMEAINRDPEVTRHLNRPVDDAAVAGFHAAVLAEWDALGVGPWAVEVAAGPDAGAFVGFVGLMRPRYLAPLADEPELGWRIARAAWGRGFATEAAAAARDDAVDRLGHPGAMSIIHPDNVRSHRVATKLGLRRASVVHNPVLDREVDVWRGVPPWATVQ